MGLWSDNMKNRIIADGGSIQRIPNIPDDIKALYKTVWEISQRTIIQMAADRGAFIDQSQSLNIHMKEPTMGKITSMHFAGWKMGLKTGMYYLRTMAASAPIQFTVDQEALKVADTNVARANGGMKKRMGSGYTATAVPRPMYQSKTPNGTSGTAPPPRSTTPPTVAAASPAKKATPRKEAIVAPAFKADVEEGDSPKLLAADASKTNGVNGHINGTNGHANGTNGKAGSESDEEVKQEEDVDADREGDIYADAVLQCSIENKDACVMCSG